VTLEEKVYHQLFMYRRPIRQVIVRIHVVVTNNRHNRGIRELFHYECGDSSNRRICYQHGRQGMSDKVASTEPKVSDCIFCAVSGRIVLQE